MKEERGASGEMQQSEHRHQQQPTARKEGRGPSRQPPLSAIHWRYVEAPGAQLETKGAETIPLPRELPGRLLPPRG